MQNPFQIFTPFSDRFLVTLFTKEDNITSDADAASRLNLTETAGLWQVHGGETIRVDGPTNRTEKADGMITSTKGLLLCTRSADCQGFVAYDPTKHVCGVLHSGWPGLLAGAVPAFIASMKQEFDVDPYDVYVGIGPSLCQKCADFTDPITELPGIDPKFFDGRHVDLQGIAHQQLRDAGVDDEKVERHPDCTRCHPGTLWTYRGGDKKSVQMGHTNMLCCSLKG